MSQSMEKKIIKFKLLTPFWTGGANTSQMNRIEETSVIGALRWWHYVFLNEKWKCECVVNKSGEEKNICPTCKIFGTTGWSRRFNMQITGDEKINEWPKPESVLKANGRRGWFIPTSLPEETKKDQSYMPEVSNSVYNLEIIPTGKKEFEQAVNDICFIFNFISEMASFGGKTSAGCGVVKVIEYPEEFDKEEFVNQFLNDYKDILERNVLMKDFFCLEISLPLDSKLNSKKLNSISPAIRLHLRNKFRNKNTNGTDKLRDLRHRLMGDKNQASTIRITNPFKDLTSDNEHRIKIYGFISHEDTQELPNDTKKLFNFQNNGWENEWQRLINNAVKEITNEQIHSELKAITDVKSHTSVKDFIESVVIK